MESMLQGAAKTILALDIVVLVLLAVSFPFLEPGTGSYVVAVLTLFPTVLTLIGSVVILYTGWDPF